MKTLEQYRFYQSNAGKIRNRTEAHMVLYAICHLADPSDLTIEQVHQQLQDELTRYCAAYPSHGTCRISDIQVSTTIMGKPHLVTRRFAIYGRGRGIYTMCIEETVRKDASNGYLPAA
ncbi:hypothetical protein [Hymenobacter fodinae]|uniref:Uncharacterized protein n=1 Tax=Hymenobacter fodinae TaxID=2510796 RepID=A0A4Z0P3W9_9BACT|nr:hypothetical protein [Hymenobacter fodinae]TGE05595.1 hypothetical protein EU556_20045 [Hymenobacter fodinae]